MTSTSRDGSKSKLKTIQPKNCVCYSVTDVVSCSGVASSINVTGLVKLIISPLYLFVQLTIVILSVLRQSMGFTSSHL